MALKYTANFKPGDNFPSGAANEIITNVNKNITDIGNLENKIKRKIELNNILTCDVLNSYVTSGIGHFSVGSLYVLTEGGNLITSSLGEPGNYPTKRVFDNAIVVVNGIGVNDDDTKVSFEVLHKGVDLTKSTLYMGEITVSDLNAFIENTEVLTKDFKYIYKLSDSGQLTSLYNYSSKEKTTEYFEIGEMVVLNYNSIGICTLNRFEKDNNVFLAGVEKSQIELLHKKGEMYCVSESESFSMYDSPDMTKNNCTIIANNNQLEIHFLENFGDVPQDKYDDEKICSDLYFPSSDNSYYIKIGDNQYLMNDIFNLTIEMSYDNNSRDLVVKFYQDSDVGIALSQISTATNIEEFKLKICSELKCFGQYNQTAGWVVYNGYYFEPLSFVTKDTINEKILEKETKFVNQQISTTSGPNAILLTPNTEIRLVGSARSDTAFVFMPTPSAMKKNGSICSVIIPCDTEKTGTIPTISLYNDVKCFGTNCSNNAFTPVSGKIYEFVFYWNGTYVCCAVNGIDV